MKSCNLRRLCMLRFDNHGYIMNVFRNHWLDSLRVKIFQVLQELSLTDYLAEDYL